MKFVCNQSDISTNLSLVSRAVPSRPTHPILANVLLIADAQTGQVSLTAFDLSLGIRTSFLAVVETGGEITLPAKLLNDIISRMPQGELAIDNEGETPLGATITSTSGQYQVRGMGVEEFPELPIIENSEAFHLPIEAIIEGLRGSLFATSADETKQILSGLHLTIEQETLEFAATDGHRLAVVQTINENAPIEADAAQLEVTVPAKALRELERMLGMLNEGAMLSLHCDRGQVVFEWENQRLTSRTLEGQYPAYRQLIPRQFEIQVTLERKYLLSAIERIAVLADQKNNIVKFTLDSSKQELALSVDAQDVGSGREAMPAQISGDSIDIAFNIKYLVDGLKALPSSEIQMQINTPTSPVILTPLGGLKMTYLIMPVQIRS
ncbi:DNA polymerase III subunit beta [Gloeocapsopsis dulcis]|uniref:Beta sliding clamp n=1 Tax=Gloeocapsopsis dulcis AAB1 = 1H9 TaxID=1433147 RepID=A0A6N8G003_9CHRO|nr:DNA polymerase III subunit beta [Gloeocapsopsis dulcis]MUL37687.1 DNA polymerase III subunit beta [Gloeocapsopsis dulcis AAB1 = 1H9]WNN88482.1 DNA polymerase III subunit beta [Gloeocapsopsis dulcis]